MSDDKVISLFDGQPVDETLIDQDMVTTLRGLLEHAEAGRIRGIAFAVTFRGAIAQTAWSDANEGQLRLAGTIALLMHRYNDHALTLTSGG